MKYSLQEKCHTALGCELEGQKPFVLYTGNREAHFNIEIFKIDCSVNLIISVVTVFVSDFSEDGNILMSSGQDQAIRIYDTSQACIRGKPLKRIRRFEAREVGWSVVRFFLPSIYSCFPFEWRCDLFAFFSPPHDSWMSV